MIQTTHIIYKLVWIKHVNKHPDRIEIVNNINKLTKYAQSELIRYGIYRDTLDYEELCADDVVVEECYVDISSVKLKGLGTYWANLANFAIVEHRKQTIDNILL